MQDDLKKGVKKIGKDATKPAPPTVGVKGKTNPVIWKTNHQLQRLPPAEADRTLCERDHKGKHSSTLLHLLGLPLGPLIMRNHILQKSHQSVVLMRLSKQ